MNAVNETNKNLSLCDFNNILEFSEEVALRYKTQPNLFASHIISTLSQELSSQAATRRAADSYFENNRDLICACSSDSFLTNHVLLPQMRLESEYTAKRILLILIASEENPKIRNDLLKIMRHHNPGIYKAAKNNNYQFISANYASLDEFCLIPEAVYDRSFYFYHSFYVSSQTADLDLINRIVYSAVQYEVASPLQVDFDQEAQALDTRISKIKAKLEKYFPLSADYHDILVHPDPNIEEISLVYENLFCINRIQIKQLFQSDKNRAIPTDILLAIAQSPVRISDDKSLLQSFIGCVFLKAFMREYQEAKTFSYKKEFELTMGSVASCDVSDMDRENVPIVTTLKEENLQLKKQLEQLKEKHSKELDRIQKLQYQEYTQLQEQIAGLHSQLAREKLFHQELYRLRELIFTNEAPASDSTGTTIEDINTALAHAISSKYIITVGGAKNWRHKLMENYPQIRCVSASNQSIDLTSFKQADCVLFFTDHISHSVYNRVMNYVRSNQINFGYIKTTNIKLLEKEIHDILQRCHIN